MSENAEHVVYVVDDDEAVRDSLKVLLESHGLRVEDYGSTGEFARSHASKGKACIILDLHLPGTGGLDYLAARSGCLRMPVIMITGRGDAATRARAEALGVLAYLDKPLNQDELLANIREAFRED